MFLFGPHAPQRGASPFVDSLWSVVGWQRLVLPAGASPEVLAGPILQAGMGSFFSPASRTGRSLRH
jgi:hypothetical protein